MANLTGFRRDLKGAFIEKAAGANIKYGVDWTDYLTTGDAISSASVAIETISGDSSALALPTDASADVTISGALVNIRLNAGTDGNVYNVRVKVVTSQGNTDARHFRIAITDKHL